MTRGDYYRTYTSRLVGLGSSVLAGGWTASAFSSVNAYHRRARNWMGGAQCTIRVEPEGTAANQSKTPPTIEEDRHRRHTVLGRTGAFSATSSRRWRTTASADPTCLNDRPVPRMPLSRRGRAHRCGP